MNASVALEFVGLILLFALGWGVLLEALDFQIRKRRMWRNIEKRIREDSGR